MLVAPFQRGACGVNAPTGSNTSLTNSALFFSVGRHPGPDKADFTSMCVAVYVRHQSRIALPATPSLVRLSARGDGAPDSLSTKL